VSAPDVREAAGRRPFTDDELRELRASALCPSSLKVHGSVAEVFASVCEDFLALRAALAAPGEPPAVDDSDAGNVHVKSPRPCPDCDDTGWSLGDPCAVCQGPSKGAALRHVYENEKRRVSPPAPRGEAVAWAVYSANGKCYEVFPSPSEARAKVEAATMAGYGGAPFRVVALVPKEAT